MERVVSDLPLDARVTDEFPSHERIWWCYTNNQEIATDQYLNGFMGAQVSLIQKVVHQPWDNKLPYFNKDLSLDTTELTWGRTSRIDKLDIRWELFDADPPEDFDGFEPLVRLVGVWDVGKYNYLPDYIFQDVPDQGPILAPGEEFLGPLDQLMMRNRFDVIFDETITLSPSRRILRADGIMVNSVPITPFNREFDLGRTCTYGDPLFQGQPKEGFKLFALANKEGVTLQGSSRVFYAD